MPETSAGPETLSRQFERNRRHLTAVAYRVLGSHSDAEDAVQEAWLRLQRTDTAEIDNLPGWLTTVVTRICLDMLRSRGTRGEPSIAEPVGEEADPAQPDPLEDVLVADAVGAAMLTVLDTLGPAERVAFVLHDLFALPFEQIGSIIDRSPAATRQLASRARRRVHGRDAEPTIDLPRQREIVDAFRAASRKGDLASLVAVLDPQVVFRSDTAAVAHGGPPELVGAQAVADRFSGQARGALPATIGDGIGLVVAPKGKLFLVLRFVFDGSKISRIDAVADPEELHRLDITVLQPEAR